MGKMQVISLRLSFLEHELKKAGGFKARSTWKENAERILSLYEERRKVKQEIKDYKPYAQIKNAYNCNPYYIAKHLKINPELVFGVIRMFTRTGKILFSRDRRNHVSSNQAKENPRVKKLTELPTVNRAQKEPNPCSAPHSEKASTTGPEVTPLTKKNGFRNNGVSRRKAEAQSTLAYTDFLLTNMDTSDSDEETGGIPNPDDYFRNSTAYYTKVYRGFGDNRKPEIIEDFDAPPPSYSYREHQRGIGMFEKDGLNLSDIGMKILGIPLPKPQEYYDRLSERMKSFGI